MQRQVWLRRYGGHLALVALLALAIAAGSVVGADAEAPASAPETIRVSSSVTPPAAAERQAADPTATPIPLVDIPTQTESGLVVEPNPRTFVGHEPAHAFVTYTVERNDTPNIIAARFGIHPETLLGGNPSLNDESNLLQTGAELTILPVDGVLHDVRRGETLSGIASQYEVTVAAIAAYGPNNLEFPYRLFPGTQLVIPGAAPRIFTWTPPALPSGNNFAVVGTGTFNWPISQGCQSNPIWVGHRAVDIALTVGTTVRAMDTGTVTYATWAQGGYYDYGNLIVVNHGNGYQTFYAHLSGINVFPGQIVTKGDFIGTTGNTGRSSGPHIHIEIRLNNVPDNPYFYLSNTFPGC